MFLFSQTLDLPIEAECIQKSHSSPEGSEKSHSRFIFFYTVFKKLCKSSNILFTLFQQKVLVSNVVNASVTKAIWTDLRMVLSLNILRPPFTTYRTRNHAAYKRHHHHPHCPLSTRQLVVITIATLSQT